MTTYLVRLKPNAELAGFPLDYTQGKVHILEPRLGMEGGFGNRVRRYAFLGAPTRCGQELQVVAQVGEPWGEPPTDRRAVLHFADRLEPGQEDNLCSRCFR